jgi:hypothetical protein
LEKLGGNEVSKVELDSPASRSDETDKIHPPVYPCFPKILKSSNLQILK